MRRYPDFVKAPTFFLSSTIYDFKDLRSALKYYLEAQGCLVLASEFNDFQKPLDLHSYEACLKAIEQADYFVLLIGSRVGGWYQPKNRVSITQQEYRRAYELQKAGRLKIITFVRAEVWQLREERKELASYLSSTTLSEDEQKRLLAYPSKFAEDADFLSAFITEVSRNKDTAKALLTGSPLVPGNWIHPFRDFSEIISAIRAQVFSGLPVEEAAMRAMLVSEIRAIVRECIPKNKEKLYPPKPFLERFCLKNPITVAARERGEMEVDSSSWSSLVWLGVHLLAKVLHAVIIEAAITSPTFLEFDLERNAYKESALYRALYRLRDEIRCFNESNNSNSLNVIFEYSKANRRDSEATSLVIETPKLAMLIFLFSRWVNILDLSGAIHAHLSDGGEFVMPALLPHATVVGLQEEIDAESPTTEETLAFLKGEHTHVRKP